MPPLLAMLSLVIAGLALKQRDGAVEVAVLCGTAPPANWMIAKLIDDITSSAPEMAAPLMPWVSRRPGTGPVGWAAWS